MGDDLHSAVGRTVSEAARALLTFWEPKHGFFWRSSLTYDQHGNDESPPRFPTATFIAVASLVEASLGFDLCPLGAVAPLPDCSAEDAERQRSSFSCESFLDRLEAYGIDATLATSALNQSWPERASSSSGPSGDGQAMLVQAPSPSEARPNLYSSAWCVRAFYALHLAFMRQGRDAGLSEDRIATLTSQTHRTVQQRGVALLRSLREELAPKRSRLQPLILYYAFDALDRAASLGAIPADEHLELCATQRTQSISALHRLIARHSAGDCPISGLLALGYHAATLSVISTADYDSLIEHALDIVCHSQAATGSWPLVRLLMDPAPESNLQVHSFDLGATMASISLRLAKRRFRWGDEENRRDAAFEALFRAIVQSTHDARFGQRVFRGWGNDHLHEYDYVESWTTALVLSFLSSYRRYLQLRVQRRILSEHATIWPSETEGWVDWTKLAQEESNGGRFGEPTPTKIIAERFLSEVPKRESTPRRAARPRYKAPVKEQRNVSMLLFGPPGTSKTTLAQALARQRRWPLLTITPGVFLAKGELMIDSEATRVFADLMQLEKVVVLFDECDALFKQRPDIANIARTGTANGQLDLSSLITGAMLPRLQTLHDRGRLIFVLATNYVLNIDDAIRRPGRFDAFVPVGPLLPGSRRRLLEQRASIHGGVLPDSDICEAFIAATAFMLRHEYVELVDAFIKCCGDSTQKMKSHEVQRHVEKLAPRDARSLRDDAIERFRSAVEKLCPQHMPEELKSWKVGH